MGVQRLDSSSFLVDEPARVGYCSECRRYFSLTKFELVHDARFDSGVIRWTTSCPVCKNDIACIIYDDEYREFSPPRFRRT